MFTLNDYMLAVVCHGPEDYRLERVPKPKPRKGEVLVRVLAAGICASDIKCYRGSPRYWGPPKPYVKAPVIPGHEFIGRVVDADPEVAEKYGFKVGDKTIAEQIIPCWKCRFCLRGEYWMCEQQMVFGFHGGLDDGAWAEYMIYPSGSIIHKVPEQISDKWAVLIEPLACAIHAVERADIKLGDYVVISGMGPLGLCMLQVAKLKGPGRLIALDVRDSRIERALKLGADEALNPAKIDVTEYVKRETGGYGCDVYIEAAGHPSSVVQGLRMIRKLGRFVEFGVFRDPVTVDWSDIGDGKELTIYGSHLGPYCYPLAIEYIRTKKVDAESIVTHVFKLENFKVAMEYSEKSLEDAVKVVLAPPGTELWSTAI
ncbi:MAG: alcohol dehydrogenase catalytic domain-containing protein [Candidatus Bathyarchaeia archaeon]